MKHILCLIFLMLSFEAFSCTDQEADEIVLDRAKAMARRYNAKKVNIGVASMLWGDTRITNISIPDGDAERIGAIYINMETCVVKAKLVSVFDSIEVD